MRFLTCILYIGTCGIRDPTPELFLTAIKPSSGKNTIKVSLPHTSNTTYSLPDTKKSRAIPGPLLRRAITATVTDELRKKETLTKFRAPRSVGAIALLRRDYSGTVNSQPLLKTRLPSLASKKSSFKKVTYKSPLPKNACHLDTQAPYVAKSAAATLPWGKSEASNGLMISPGESYLIDIPMGTKDSVDRLIKAAAFRCHVPSFAAESNAQDVSSLVKLREEEEIISSRVIVNLKSLGILVIEDLLPLTKLKVVLRDAGANEVITKQCVEMIKQLIKMSSFAAGKPQKKTVAASKELLRDQRQPSPPRPLPAEKNVNFEKFEKEVNQEGEVNTLAPYKLLDMAVDGEGWCTLQASVDDLLMHAAFIVCTEEGLEEDLGQDAFLAYAKQLLRTNDTDTRKNLVQQRYRLALILSAPYAVTLRMHGYSSVLDMARINLSEVLDMPLQLLRQVEAFISTATAKTCNSKKAFLSYSSLEAMERRDVAVPLLFDPKFQRSPFDPYGRPPRTGDLRESLRKVDPSALPNVCNIDGEDCEMPPGLWEQSQSDANNSKAASNHYMGNFSPSKARPFPSVLKLSPEGTMLYQCSHPDCDLWFHRRANLFMHEKSHGYLAYGTYKREAQVNYDQNKEDTRMEMARKYLKSVELSPSVIDELIELC